MLVLAQQRYAKSHRILANCRGRKGFSAIPEPSANRGIQHVRLPREDLRKPGIRIPSGARAGGYAALSALAAHPGLHRNDAGP